MSFRSRWIWWSQEFYDRFQERERPKNADLEAAGFLMGGILVMFGGGGIGAAVAVHAVEWVGAFTGLAIVLVSLLVCTHCIARVFLSGDGRQASAREIEFTLAHRARRRATTKPPPPSREG